MSEPLSDKQKEEIFKEYQEYRKNEYEQLIKENEKMIKEIAILKELQKSGLGKSRSKKKR
ncbi:hypothetical protein ACTQ54_01205 [Fundicoccus sp. Sow4_H7]|uniref:hypothetical protein n=1 Tax=Fundicoccus sp. Sow4_H7 TaxID=3438784 RepID=UPI003F903B70